MGLSKLTQKNWEQLLYGIMAIERRYGFERKNVTSARRSDVREHIEKFSAEHLEAESSK
jgi:hypothetical protein